MTTNHLKLPSWMIFLFVVLTGLVLSLYLTTKIQNRLQDSTMNKFFLMVNTRLHEIELTLQDLEETISAMTALFYSDDNVSEQEFNKFADIALVHRELFYMLGWVPKIANSDRQAYVNKAQSWYPLYQIMEKTGTGQYIPALNQDFYYPLYYIVPERENAYRYGIDFSTEAIWPAFLQAMHEPDRTFLNVKTFNDTRKSYNALLLRAVERLDDGTPEVTIKGFVIGSIKLNEILDRIFKNYSPYIEEQPNSFYLFDGKLEDDSKLLYAYHYNSSNAKEITFRDLYPGNLDRLFVKKEVKFGDHSWVLLHTLNESHSSLISTEALLALFLGITTTVLAGFSVWMLSHHADRQASVASIREMMERQFKQMHEKLLSQEKLVSLGELAAGIAHEVRNPLNLVNNFSQISIELIDELKEKLKTASSKEEIEELCLLLQDNMNKIHGQGQRAERVIEGVLAIARDKSGEKRPTNLPELIEDAINLSYQAMRGKDSSFNVKIVKHFDASVNHVECIREDIHRVLINLFNNAFYSMNLKKKMHPTYIPTVTIETKNLGKLVSIVIKDDGIGISDEAKSKLFTPFFTTKPNNEGTGIGLSLSKDIIVQGHQGQLLFESKVNEFACFTIILPKLPI